jgi:hypothetical protein
MKRIVRAVLVVAAISVASCGGSNVSQSPTPTGASTASDGSDSSTAPAAIVITRTGGIAGVRDVVEISADGSAQVTQKNGVTVPCTPNAGAIDRVRAIDLPPIGTAPPKAPIADGFTYEMVTPAGSASVSDGAEGPHRELLQAAAEVVSSCIATASGSSPTY